MLALSVVPGSAGSARIEDVPEPGAAENRILVKTRAIGVCGTDLDIVAGAYGCAPPGENRLIIGHESLGVVEAAPRGAAFAAGDLVVGIVRRPDPVPCASCAAGEWDMCRNGLYTERGIHKRHGYGAERFRLAPEFAVKVDPGLGLRGVLLEPASVVAKAWEQVDRIGRRGIWNPATALITGAGSVGLLAALMGVQRGLQVHVFDRATEGPKPDLVRDLGAFYHSGSLGGIGLNPDIVIECTGASPVILGVIDATAPAGIVCLAGLSSGGHRIDLDLGALNRTMVLENDVIFGSVNANRRHYELAAAALARADPGWLERLISRRVPFRRWHEVLARHPGDVKVVLTFDG